MRRLLLLVLLAALPVLAEESSAEMFHRQHVGRFQSSRHVVIEPQHVLSDDEKRDLAQKGLAVGQVLGGGRYIARLAADAIDLESDPRLRSIEELTIERKVQRSAWREAARSSATGRFNVLFHEDISFEDARRAIESVGGSLQAGLAIDFELPRRLEAHVPSTALEALAADDRVLTIYGPNNLRPVSDNVTSANVHNVTPLHSGPYNLTGNGVVLSMFELAPADAAHREFGGRVTTHFTGGSSDDTEHATHVAGTMVATGLEPAAKGMAPNATLHHFSSRGSSNWLNSKEKSLTPLNVVADNNSWGYILGWCTNPNCNGWVWTGDDDLYGGYFYLNAALDKIALSNGALMVHSAGNDGSKYGPQEPPFDHKHVDPQTGATITDKTYCYSADGTGNDCAFPCTTGAEYCEKTRHPVNAPFLSVGVTASSKNVLTVGATDSAKFIATFSSRGPTRDGRVKPDVTARGFGTYSSIPGNLYGRKNGTSMAAPVVTAVAGLVAEQWRKSYSGASPSPQTIKTLIIAGSEDLGLAGPDWVFGHGFVNARQSVDLVIADGGTGSRVQVSNVAQGAQFEVPVTVSASGTVRATLGWADPEVILLEDELAAKTLVNDLDIRLIAADGTVFLPYVLDGTKFDAVASTGVNTVDNLEMIEVKNAAPGNYRLIVTGTRIAASSPQRFTVVTSNAAMGAAKAPCIDPTEPNSSEGEAYGLLVTGSTVMGRTCEATDADVFKFRVDRSGAVSVRVTATDTPLRVTLSGAGVTTATGTVPAGATQTISTTLGSGNNQLVSPPVTFFARIEAAGAIGNEASYTLTPIYNFVVPPHRRATGR